jgi:hypothetical protein
MQTFARTLAFQILALGFTLSLVFSNQSATAKPAAPKLADLAWLAGHWSGEQGGVRTEEVWLAPAGGFLLGMNRSVSGHGRGSFEFLRIEERAGEIVYVASPGGSGATEFSLRNATSRSAEFANPKHDFPQVIRYELDGEGTLRASVSGKMGGEERVMSWVWKRAP